MALVLSRNFPISRIFKAASRNRWSLVRPLFYPIVASRNDAKSGTSR